MNNKNQTHLYLVSSFEDGDYAVIGIYSSYEKASEAKYYYSKAFRHIDIDILYLNKSYLSPVDYENRK